jgi:hypothetical protein
VANGGDRTFIAVDSPSIFGTSVEHETCVADVENAILIIEDCSTPIGSVVRKTRCIHKQGSLVADGASITASDKSFAQRQGVERKDRANIDTKVSPFLRGVQHGAVAKDRDIIVGGDGDLRTVVAGKV